jgi:hypothetical protein
LFLNISFYITKNYAYVRFGFTTKTIGEHGSPLHYFGNCISFIQLIFIINFLPLLSGRIISAPTKQQLLSVYNPSERQKPQIFKQNLESKQNQAANSERNSDGDGRIEVILATNNKREYYIVCEGDVVFSVDEPAASNMHFVGYIKDIYRKVSQIKN